MIEKINYYAKLVGMQNFLERNPETLSGGEKQRVAIAGVLACNPEVILFDEATSMLDPKAVKEVLDTIKDLKGDKTILYVTHSLNEALLADKIIVMKKGEIILQGTKEEVFDKVDILKDASLDILDEIKLIKLIEQSGIKNKKEIVELLWQLAYQM
jgi:energy-coupling factor transport system ATP-binding protein